MDFSSLIPAFGNLAVTVAAFILALIPIVGIHEFGHYIVGRWSGIKADVFSIGAGPVLVSRTDRRGTRWQIAALPVGGYVKFHGDQNAASANADTEALSHMDEAERRQTGAGLAGPKGDHRGLARLDDPVVGHVDRAGYALLGRPAAGSAGGKRHGLADGDLVAEHGRQIDEIPGRDRAGRAHLEQQGGQAIGDRVVFLQARIGEAIFVLPLVQAFDQGRGRRLHRDREQAPI